MSTTFPCDIGSFLEKEIEFLCKKQHNSKHIEISKKKYKRMHPLLVPHNSVQGELVDPRSTF